MLRRWFSLGLWFTIRNIRIIFKIFKIISYTSKFLSSLLNTTTLRNYNHLINIKTPSERFKITFLNFNIFRIIMFDQIFFHLSILLTCLSFTDFPSFKRHPFFLRWLTWFSELLRWLFWCWFKLHTYIALLIFCFFGVF